MVGNESECEDDYRFSHTQTHHLQTRQTPMNHHPHVTNEEEEEVIFEK